MLFIAGQDEAGNLCGIMIMEPGNLQRLREGKPICKDMDALGLSGVDRIMLAYTPDIDWLVARLKQIGAPSIERICEALKESLERPEVLR